MPPLVHDLSIEERIRILKEYDHHPQAEKKYCTECGRLLAVQTFGWYAGNHYGDCYND